MKKYFKGLVAVIPPLTAVAIQLIVVTGLGMAYSFLMGLIAGLEKTGGTFDLTAEVNYLFFAFSIMSCGIVFIFWYRRETFGEARGKLSHVVNIKNTGRFVGLGLGCQLFVSGVLSILTDYFPKAFDQYGDTVSSILSGSPIMVVIVTVVIAPITEELIFRGVTFHRANRHIPVSAANILQAVLFGIYHGDLIQGIYAAILGFILGLIYQKFSTIYAPILLHMLVNASAFFIMLLPESKLSYFIMSMIGFVLIYATLRLINPRKVLVSQESLINR